MRSRHENPDRALIALLFLIAALCLGIVYSGIYNMLAIEGHGPFERWLFNTTMEHSVRRHAENVAVADLTNPDLIQVGFDHYDAMCLGCHGVPGVPPTALAKGLSPRPPELTENANDWSPAEFYGIVKNGIKMTGMPAGDSTHRNKELSCTHFLNYHRKNTG